MDVVVGDRDDAGIRGDGDLMLGGADELAGEGLAPVERLARAHTGAAAAPRAARTRPPGRPFGRRPRRRLRAGARGPGSAGSPRARDAAWRPARAGAGPRDGARASAASGPGRRARSRSSEPVRRPL